MQPNFDATSDATILQSGKKGDHCTAVRDCNRAKRGKGGFDNKNFNQRPTSTTLFCPAFILDGLPALGVLHVDAHVQGQYRVRSHESVSHFCRLDCMHSSQRATPVARYDGTKERKKLLTCICHRQDTRACVLQFEIFIFKVRAIHRLPSCSISISEVTSLHSTLPSHTSFHIMSTSSP